MHDVMVNHVHMWIWLTFTPHVLLCGDPGDSHMTGFLFLFGVINMLTPIVLLSTPDPGYELKQRNLMRNMFITGACVVFVSMGMYFIS